jgi:hypothetical protein
MNEPYQVYKSKSITSVICKIFIVVGNSLTILGCLGIVLGLLGVYDLDIVSYGLSSGIRIVGSVAIAGCLLSAIGYGVSDFFIN